MDATDRQHRPTGTGTKILPLVIADLRARSDMGRKKYGTTLRANNGRDALLDAYQEALDLCMYLRQVIEERVVRLDEDEQYYDIDGNPVSLDKLCRIDPAWAASIIRWYRSKLRESGVDDGTDESVP